MDEDGEGTTGPAQRPLAARLAGVPLPGLVAALVVYGGAALGLAALGGWGGLAAVFCVAALMAAAVVVASDG